MFKKSLFALLILGILLGCQALSFAAPAPGAPPAQGDVYLGDTRLEFEAASFFLKGHLMVPAHTFLERMGAQVVAFGDEDTLIAYRDNMFLKFYCGDQVAHVNGRPTKMPLRAVRYGGLMYLPADFIASTFNMRFSYAEKSRALVVNYRENIPEYRTLSGRVFRRINVFSSGISFYIPEHWTSNPESPGVYTSIDEFETYTLKISLLKLPPEHTRSDFSKLFQEQLGKDDAIRLSEARGNVPLGEYKADVLTYTRAEGAVPMTYIVYLFVENGMGYTLTASYPKDTASANARTIMDTIAQTFSINNLSVNTYLEHYIEMTPFFTRNMHLDREVYSNIILGNQLPFSGTILGESDSELHIVVSKDSSEFEYYIPIVNNTFKGNIYTPFGLGKHNIVVSITGHAKTGSETLALPPRILSLDNFVDDVIAADFDDSLSNTLLKFSVVNVSGEPIKDILPTEYVNYDFQKVYAISNTVTYNMYSDYTKARALYMWIYKTYTYKDTVHLGGLKSLIDIVESTSANDVELCILYTGLLRANNIPARIARGYAEGCARYWVEMRINGQWMLARIGEEVRTKDNTSVGVSLFNIPKRSFYDALSAVEYLSF